MGNCQAIDAAALVIQHPSGKIERMFWSVSANEVMKLNPGHYVSLIIPLPVDGEENSEEKIVRFTRVKLLRPNDTLVLGRAYRLVTTKEVMKVLRAKKYAKMKKNQAEAMEASQNSSCHTEANCSEQENTSQVMRLERCKQRSGSANLSASRSKSWRPSLQSISEAAS